MIRVFDEGRKVVNNIPLSVQCLLMSDQKPQEKWPIPHYHEYIELLYPVMGDYRVTLDGQIYDMPQGSLFVINSGEAHSTFGLTENRLLFCIKFMPQVLYSAEQSVSEFHYSIPFVFENLGHKRCFSANQLKDTFIPKSFETVIRENKERCFGYELAIRAEVMKVFAWVLRYWYESGDATIDVDAETFQIITKARQYVEKNYAEADLKSVADECNLSYSYFSRTFKRVMKVSFTDYVNLVRVNASMKLLSSGEQSITEIALASGFSSTSYYIQVFKKFKNVSPNTFRKMLR